MAANTLPIFPGGPRIAVGLPVTLATTRAGTAVASLGLIFTAGANGSRIDSVTINATATTAAGLIRLWYATAATGVTGYMWNEIIVPVVTVSATVAAWTIELLPINWMVPALSAVFATSELVTGGFQIIVRGGDY